MRNLVYIILAVSLMQQGPRNSKKYYFIKSFSPFREFKTDSLPQSTNNEWGNFRDKFVITSIIFTQIFFSDLRFSPQITFSIQRLWENTRHKVLFTFERTGQFLTPSPLYFYIRFKNLVYGNILELPQKNGFSDQVPAIVLSSYWFKMTLTCGLIIIHKSL